MARLIRWQPSVAALSLVDGPGALGFGSNDLADGVGVQTFAKPGWVWRFSLTLTPRQYTSARRHRGYLAALNSGANAFVYHFDDGQLPRLPEYGLAEIGATWGEGASWGEGAYWEQAKNTSTVDLSRDHSEGDTVLYLEDASWGHLLDYGDIVGFSSVFGGHMVSEVIQPGRYRITPPLRADLIVDRNIAHLSPSIVLRPTQPPNLGDYAPTRATGLGGQMVEVLHADALQYFSGD